MQLVDYLHSCEDEDDLSKLCSDDIATAIVNAGLALSPQILSYHFVKFVRNYAMFHCEVIIRGKRSKFKTVFIKRNAEGNLQAYYRISHAAFY